MNKHRCLKSINAPQEKLFQLIVNAPLHHLLPKRKLQYVLHFDPGLFNFSITEFMVEKSGVKKSEDEKS